MAKSPDAFRTISEVAEWLGVQAHVLRFWEGKFPQIRPVKRAGGRRYYRPADMALLGGIKVLLHDDGQTIKDVQKMLREDGVDAVTAKSPPVDAPAATTSIKTDADETPSKATAAPTKDDPQISFDLGPSDMEVRPPDTEAPNKDLPPPIASTERPAGEQDDMEAEAKVPAAPARKATKATDKEADTPAPEDLAATPETSEPEPADMPEPEAQPLEAAETASDDAPQPDPDLQDMAETESPETVPEPLDTAKAAMPDADAAPAARDVDEPETPDAVPEHLDTAYGGMPDAEPSAEPRDTAEADPSEPADRDLDPLESPEFMPEPLDTADAGMPDIDAPDPAEPVAPEADDTTKDAMPAEDLPTEDATEQDLDDVEGGEPPAPETDEAKPEASEDATDDENPAPLPLAARTRDPVDLDAIEAPPGDAEPEVPEELLSDEPGEVDLEEALSAEPADAAQDDEEIDVPPSDAEPDMPEELLSDDLGEVDPEETLSAEPADTAQDGEEIDVPPGDAEPDVPDELLSDDLGEVDPAEALAADTLDQAPAASTPAARTPAGPDSADLLAALLNELQPSPGAISKLAAIRDLTALPADELAPLVQSLRAWVERARPPAGY